MNAAENPASLGLESRGLTWLRALSGADGKASDRPASVRVVDALLGNESARFVAVVPDAANRFPRARKGEVGLEEGWALAQAVRAVLDENVQLARRPVVAIVDVIGQAYGRREELLGIHLACAAAADAYASARLAGHPVVALLVGSAMSGAFLAHGYQANRILALDSPEVRIHAMGAKSAARVTRRSVEELEDLGREQPPMAYDVRSFARLGLLHRLIEGVDAETPSATDVECVRRELIEAVVDIRAGGRGLESRLSSNEASGMRAASIEVRRRLAEQWDAA